MTAILQQPARTARPRTTGAAAMVLGTRPEIFQLAPVLCALGDLARVVRVGGDLPTPAAQPPLPADTDPRTGRLADTLDQLDRVFAADRPDVVVVRGATPTALAGALAANSNGIPLVHVDAGLRSRDLTEPEEHNRVLVDRLSDVLCAPTTTAVDNLHAEGLGGRDVRLTGNTTAEAVRHRLLAPEDRRKVLDKWGLRPDGYVLATLDRPDNVEHPDLTRQLARLADAGYPVVLPAAPRVRAALIRASARTSTSNLRLVNRLWHSEFLALARHAALLVTDSGAVQEEATVLKRPVVVVRRSTERPEVLGHFGRLAAPHDLADVALDRLQHRDDLRDVPCPFGDGHAGTRIAQAVRDLVRQR
ncbi:UDP-N-acetyl glucosamine 2-epimerase [Saccharothrix variisporea]|uniref:UDP-N-acetylglucosamine 2-epimerase (Non-hydrolysing) n=1 Tax=Saccharothrix variisporea TaxID=543527 RepID=A0A495X133_9PSEU|nr:UDP-N-acetylglucosamine 2-epimerase [Saccharothrix variisporea]RKT67630.1 UDP-N-acetylglucosamine 2-epimerase (non-hydrolysing) [Saccharothrix variisporea]